MLYTFVFNDFEIMEHLRGAANDDLIQSRRDLSTL